MTLLQVLYGRLADTTILAYPQLLFFDTEGFEGTGKSDSYDDRIFALAAMLSSTLIYNLREAVRESDVRKLAFAVELARGFFDTGARTNAGTGRYLSYTSQQSDAQ